MKSNGELFNRRPFVREQRNWFLARNPFALNVIDLLSHISLVSILSVVIVVSQ